MGAFGESFTSHDVLDVLIWADQVLEDLSHELEEEFDWYDSDMQSKLAELAGMARNALGEEDGDVDQDA